MYKSKYLKYPNENKDYYHLYQKYKIRYLNLKNKIGGGTSPVPYVQKLPKIPEEFICPLSREIMSDPVTIDDNNNYERKAIMEWFESNGSISPINHNRINKNIIVPNLDLKNRIEEFKKKYAIEVDKIDKNIRLFNEQVKERNTGLLAAEEESK